MDLNDFKANINNQEEYILFVKQFITLLDEQFNVWEEESQHESGLHSLSESMPAIISLVNTVGYLRGQDGVFLNIRPRTDMQNKLYKLEDIFEKRLQKLIDVLMQSPAKEYYLKRLQKYFIDARSNKFKNN